MPKKRASLQFSKPASPVHPSLSSSGPAPKSQNLPRSLHSASSITDNAVNDLIQRQRLSHASPTPKIAERSREPGNVQTLPPSIKAILQGPNPPFPQSRLHYRMSDGRIFRGPAGPPPPSSWLREGNHHSRRANDGDSGAEGHAWPDNIHLLPGLGIPDERSLLFQTLKALAIYWDWHLEYDRDGLVTLPIKYKERLLYFMARYNPGRMTRAGFEALFLDEGVLNDETDGEALTHLDLSTSISPEFSLKDLMDCFVKKPDDISAPRKEISFTIPDAWDTPASFSTSPNPILWFSTITHLSLSHPVHASWKSFLRLAPHLTPLTHLALASWPTPSPSPHSEIRPNHGAPYFYSQTIDGDRSEAAAILRRLSRATYCLKWLDLTGCCGWIWALQCADGADWRGAWRGVHTVLAGQEEQVVDLPSMKAGVDWFFETPRPISQGHGRDSWIGLLEWLRYARRLGKLEELVNQLKARGRAKDERRGEMLDFWANPPTINKNNDDTWWHDSSSELTAPNMNTPRSNPSASIHNRVVFNVSSNDEVHQRVLSELLNDRGVSVECLEPFL
jgi:hypothetical protein